MPLSDGDALCRRKGGSKLLSRIRTVVEVGCTGGSQGEAKLLPTVWTAAQAERRSHNPLKNTTTLTQEVRMSHEIYMGKLRVLYIQIRNQTTNIGT